MRRRPAFTIVELITIIALLAILTALAIPRYQEYRGRLESTNEQVIVDGVNSALHAYYARMVGTGAPPYPNKLDNASPSSYAGPTNPFFNFIMDVPLTKAGWQKGSDPGIYISPAGNHYIYSQHNGSLAAVSTGG